MQVLHGRSERDKDRILNVACEDERVYLWIHPPDSKDGYSIYVDRAEFIQSLRATGAISPE